MDELSDMGPDDCSLSGYTGESRETVQSLFVLNILLNILI